MARCRARAERNVSLCLGNHCPKSKPRVSRGWRSVASLAMRDPRYDILFEPVEIGPVTARNRFFQVPHCNGMGHRHPAALAAMRGVKAEGGWAVVCTEEVEIHPTSDLSPYIEGRNWDQQDIAALAMTADKIHEHGSLAGIELVHNGLHVSNNYTRLAPIGPSALLSLVPLSATLTPESGCGGS